MWIKQGLIFNVKGTFSWARTHAQVPVADLLQDRIRIYYATRDDMGRSNVSFIEVDKRNPLKILYEHDRPLLQHGKLGTFDDSGIMPSCILNVDNKKFLYYIGWTTRGTVPYQNSVGLAISEDNGQSFQKLSEGPIIHVNQVEPYFSGTSYVMKDIGKYKMWYLSCVGWIHANDHPEPLYNIKYAESPDAINWEQTGKVAIELQEDEGGLVSAAVIKTNNLYRMWFGQRKKTDYRSNRNNSYRIGYAESKDGINWKRKDENAGIDVSNTGWDSEMQSYPYILETEDKLLMFYNGNGFGKSGFGFAELKL